MSKAKVPVEEWNRACGNIARFYGGKNNGREIYDFTGHAVDYTPSNYDYFTFDEEIARKVRLLASPHHKTILQMHEINRKEAS